MNVPYLAFVALGVVTGLWAAGHALLSKSDPRAAWGWILICWLLPVGGPLLYFALGINRVERKARRLRPAGTTSQPEQADTQHEALPPHLLPLARLTESLTGQALLPSNQVRALVNGEQAYPAMREAISKAEHSVLLESYIFDCDEVGEAFIACLIAAHARGVTVRVLVDGTADLGRANTCAASLLRDAGVAVALYHPLHPWQRGLRTYFNLRNHRKLLIVDGKQAFTGGMNITADGLLNRADMGWTQTDLHFEFRGSVIDALAASFWEDWKYSGGKGKSVPGPVEKHSETGSAACRVVSDGPNEPVGKLNLVIAAALAAAEDRAQIVTPYFLPTPELIAALHSAVLRGVRVEVILPALSDHQPIHYAVRHGLSALLAKGIHLYYQAPPFSHTKLLVIDGQYTLLGSANLDPRSLRLNFELNVEVFDPDLAQEMHQHCDAIKARAHTIKIAELRRAPLWQRLRNAFCWLFSPYF